MYKGDRKVSWGLKRRSERIVGINWLSERIAGVNWRSGRIVEFVRGLVQTVGVKQTFATVEVHRENDYNAGENQEICVDFTKLFTSVATLTLAYSNITGIAERNPLLEIGYRASEKSV